MLDLRFVRDHAEQVRRAIRDKRMTDALASLDALLIADEQRRVLRVELEAKQARRNAASREIGTRKRAGQEAEELIREMAGVSSEVKRLEDRDASLAAQIDGLMLEIPNIPHRSVPFGESEHDNVVVAEHGARRSDEGLVPHWELGARKGWFDVEAGVKVAGAGFPVFRGDGARLVRGMSSFFLDRLRSAGYEEVIPPLMVHAAAATATGQLPDKEGQMYAVAGGFFLIPTSEVPVTNLHRGQILDTADLPVRYCAYTPCFRREAGSYGRDVRGLNRLHQFEKVEMVQFTRPEDSYDALETMTETAEALVRELGLAYRRLLMCTGDLGFAQAKKYDIEVWSPGQERWLEVSSISNLEAFQANRLGTRSRPGGASGRGPTASVHTLNGSALAFPRTIAALLETHQRRDGSVPLPEPLRPFVGLEVLSEPARLAAG